MIPLPSPIQPTEIYATFCGPIEQVSVQRIFQGAALAMTNRIGHIYLLFQSSGGYVGDSVCLYNFFRSLTVDLTLYNVGSIQSGAVVAFLGAKKRKTSAPATFMVHRTLVTQQSANTTRLKAATEGIILDDKRTESILREHLKLTDQQWSDLDNRELYFSGEEAVQVGLANEIGEFSPPPGTQIFNL